jgi:hypothetical protein
MAFRKVIGGILRSPDGVARRWLAHSDEPYIQSARGAVTKTPSLRWNLLIDAVVTACAQFLDEIPFRENPAAFSVEAMEAGEPLRAVDAQIAAGQLLEALPPEPPLVG